MSKYPYIYIIDDDTPPPDWQKSGDLLLSFGNTWDYEQGENAVELRFMYKEHYDQFVEHVKTLRKFN